LHVAHAKPSGVDAASLQSPGMGAGFFPTAGSPSRPPARIAWVVLLLLPLACPAGEATPARESMTLFDGRTFQGWEGDTNKTWRVERGVIVGGSLKTTVPQNEFLVTSRPYTNFALRLEFKLVGTEGFVNGGVQIRSERLQNPPNEMCGYQADIGDGWWGALYDESRRNKPLVQPDKAAVEKALKPGDWNVYRIRCEDRRIRSWINDVPMIDYTEPDPSIPQHGRIGLQIHGGAKAEISFRNLTLEEL
jgi:hypothetical protein